MQFSAMNWACMSVGKPGYSVVRKLCALQAALRTARGCRRRTAVTLGARFAQLVDHGVQVVGAAVAQHDVAAGGGHRAQEGAGLDAVGHHRCVQPCSCSTPWMRMRLVPWPSIFAPIAISISARSAISGSCAAFSSTVSPSASAAAISRFSVPVTVTMSVRDARALQARAALRQLGDHVAVLDLDLGAHRLQALDVLVDRARADGAAAGQRHRGLAEARQQRAQHQHRGAHGLHQLVRRFGLIERAGVDAHGAVARRARRCTPMLRSSLSMVATSCRRGTLCSVTGSVGQQARRTARAARRSWRRKSRTSPCELAAAANQQFVHGI